MAPAMRPSYGAMLRAMASGNSPLERDVTQCKATSRLEHAGNLPEDIGFVGCHVQDAIRYEAIDRRPVYCCLRVGSPG